MAGAGERTEQASPRRREELRRKGSGVGRSRELSLAASVAVGFLVLSVTLPDAVAAFRRLILESIDGALRAETGTELLLARLGDGIAVGLGIVLPVAIAVAISEIIANLASGGSNLDDTQYVDIDGEQGWFQTEHRVYGRAGEVCLTCKKARISRTVVAGRTTCYCAHCQH